MFLLSPQKIMQHMYGIIPLLFDCWANPVVYLLLKSSMDNRIGPIVGQSKKLLFMYLLSQETGILRAHQLSALFHPYLVLLNSLVNATPEL